MNERNAGEAPAVTPEAAAGLAQRTERLDRVLALQEPDRVPFVPSTNNLYATHYPGLTTVREWMTDPTCMIPVMERYLKDYDPDLVWTPSHFPIPPMETLGYKYSRWPGPYWNLPDNTSYQYIDGSFLDEDLYEEFFKDPSLYLMTKIVPQKMKNLAGLAMLNPYGMVNQCVLAYTPFGLPPVQEALRNLIQAGTEIMEYLGKAAAVDEVVRNAGYPTFGSASMITPFDDFADHVRGLLELCLDIVIQPEDVDRACALWGDVTIPAAIATAKMSHQKYIFVPLHCGAEMFMSPDKYRDHYWPVLKRCLEAAIAADLTPIVFCEGGYTSRLDYIRDIEPGKVIYVFEDVDLKLAKEKLGGIVCIGGGMKTGTLMFGKPEDVEDEVKRTLDIMMPGGGYFSANTVALDKVPPEIMHAWREAIEKYGKY